MYRLPPKKPVSDPNYKKRIHLSLRFRVRDWVETYQQDIKVWIQPKNITIYPYESCYFKFFKCVYSFLYLNFPMLANFLKKS